MGHPFLRNIQARLERVVFEHPAVYRAKCFIIQEVIWKRILTGMLGLKDVPLPSVATFIQGKSVLVGACGPGDVSTGPPIDAAGSVTAFDLSPEFVAACQRNRPEWTVFQGDILSIPYPDKAFDVSLIYSTLHHVPANAKLVLQELARVTCEHVIIMEGVVPEKGLLRAALLVWYRLVDGGVHYYTREELNQVFKDIGLEPVQLSFHSPISHMMFTVLRRRSAASSPIAEMAS